MNKQYWSIKSVVALLVLVIAGFGWFVLATEYAKEMEGFKLSGYIELRPRRNAGGTETLADAVGGQSMQPRMRSTKFQTLHQSFFSASRTELG